jgi:putative oxidoreductase
MKKTIMKKIMRTATQIYSVCERAVSHLQSPLLLAVRLYWGWQFFQTGLGKLTHIAKIIDFFTSLGIPFPAFNAYFVGSLECVGGALLFLGLGSRIIALPLMFNMLVAYITADREALFSIFSDPGKFYAADPYTFFFAALLVLIFGPGKISIDSAISYLRRRKVAGPQDLRQTSALSAT